MNSQASMGWALVALGGVMVIFGLIWVLAPSLPWLGKLPGDIRVERDGFSFYFPAATCLVLSVVLTVLLSVAVWLFRSVQSGSRPPRVAQVRQDFDPPKGDARSEVGYRTARTGGEGLDR